METRSYFHQASQEPLLYATIPDFLEQRATEIPDSEAYVFRHPPLEDVPGPERSSICFRELEERSAHLAAAFLELGFEPGDRVAAMGPFCKEWVIMDYALLKIKVAAIRVSRELTTQSSLKAILEKHTCRSLILHPGHKESFAQSLEQGSPGFLKKDPKVCPDNVRFVVSMTGSTSLDLTCIHQMMASEVRGDTLERVRKIQASICPDDLATIYMSSGSTGAPKAIPCSHFSLVNNTFHTVAPALGGLQTGVSRYFIDRLPHWIATFPFTTVVCGISMVQVDPRYTCNAFGKYNDFLFRVMREENITCAMMMPYLMYDIVGGIEKSGMTLPDQLTHVMTGGERLPIDIVRSTLKYVPNIAMIYGTSEVGLAMVAEIDPRKRDEDILEGYVCRHFEFKVVNEQGETVERGTHGELLIRGPSAFSGYLDDPQRTSEAFAAGRWFRTSDYAAMSQAGKVKILARKSDVISYLTSKIFPQQYEKLLVEHENVAKAVVVGVPDERMYEIPCACVVTANGEDIPEEELHDYFRRLLLDTDSISLAPKYFFFVDAFPEVNGKINRRKIRQLAAQKFGSSRGNMGVQDTI